MPPSTDSGSEEHTENKSTEATLKIPFESAKSAEIAYRVLSVDKEPRRNFVQKELRLVGDQIEVHFIADQVKNLRTAITSFFGALLLCTDTIKEFAPITTDNDNAGAYTSANST
ncbi:uncharacterized protein LOC105216707 [Zeugodacus cucurbitae]|uniref:uncharacterized protein LOC105216707 n=1 Tax=Zeugodacus cucurbitae TaxID=28588 RepID=UPI0005969165|nr:uncharacterized protein LOC105216707 [Zeugodacus cucurbitae]